MRKILYFLGFLPIIAVGIFFKTLPSRIPIHFNLYGEVDSWGPKYTLIIIALFPVLLNIIIIISSNLLRKKAKNEDTDKRRQEIINNIKSLLFVGIVTQVVINLTIYFIVYKAIVSMNTYNSIIQFDIEYFAIIIGIAFILVGNIMPKCKRNSFIGIRTKWSISSDVAWNKSQLSGGILFIVSGILNIIIASFFKGINVIVAMFIISVLLAVAVYIASYKAWKTTL